MADCLILGGVTTEMAIEDNSEAIAALIATLATTGEASNLLLEDVNQTMRDNEKQLKLMNRQVEEAFDTTITEEDIEDE